MYSVESGAPKLLAHQADQPLRPTMPSVACLLSLVLTSQASCRSGAAISHALAAGADVAQQCRTATMMRIVLLMKQGAAEKCPSNFIFDFVANGLIDVKFACVKRMPSLIDLGIDAAIVGEPMGLKLAYAVQSRLAYQRGCGPAT